MPPILYRCVVAAASRIVPRRTRTEWRAHWGSGLREWWVLVERGDVTVRTGRDVCRSIVAAAWRERFGEARIDRLVKGPAAVLAVPAVSIALLGWMTSGFAYTRTIPDENDRIFGHAFLMSFAMAAAVFLVVFRGVPLRGRGWRYWTFLTLKTTLVLLFTTLVWIEGGAAVRAAIHRRELSGLIGGVVVGAAYLAAFPGIMGWCFYDQRRRCPVCFRRLEYPVRLGKWSSVLDPVGTELVCPDGHGLLYDSQGEARWTELDASWKGL
jgi:hypothetical protein